METQLFADKLITFKALENLRNYFSVHLSEDLIPPRTLKMNSPRLTIFTLTTNDFYVNIQTCSSDFKSTA